MHPLTKILVLLPLMLMAWAFLFVAWLGASIKGDPTWIPWLSACSAILLLTAGVAVFLRGPAALIVKRIALLFGGIGLAAVMAHVLIVEPHQRSESQATNNRLLNERRMADALALISCPSGKTLVVVPGIPIVQGESTRHMLELYLLPVDPTQRAVKLANTRYDGKVIEAPALTELRPEIIACLASPDDLQTLLRQMEGGAEEPHK